MLEFAVDDVGPDQRFGVGVRSEACALLDSVFINDSQGSELSVIGIIVRGEREGVVGIQPAMISVAARIPRALGDLEIRCAVCRCHRAFCDV